jgi:G3E family GTPase
VGKTATVQHLLKHRPKHERWAVLVNEFGSLGVDQGLLSDDSVVVSQVAGGCLCCAAGPVTRVKLNQLLRQARPHRLLIEPSGVAHPHEILNLLAAPEYQGVLRLEHIITLLDPRHLCNPRYQNFPALQQQIQLAHQIALNKTDCCDDQQLAEAQAWLAKQTEMTPALVTQGQIPDAWWLTVSAGDAPAVALPDPALDWTTPVAPLPDWAWQVHSHEAHGLYTLSWRIARQHHWDADRLEHVLFQCDGLRVKGIVPTNQGWTWFNLAEGDLSMGPSQEQSEAVIEFIEVSPIDPTAVWRAFRPALIEPEKAEIRPLAT